MSEQQPENQGDSKEPETTQSSQDAPSEKSAPRNQLGTLILEGNLRTKNSISMLFSDVLSQELNTALVAPETMGVIQKHLQNQPLEQLGPKGLEPLMANIPESVLDIVKEALFCSGVGNKRIDCQYPLKVGDKFIFRGSGLMGELTLLDGRVVGIQPLTKR